MKVIRLVYNVLSIYHLIVSSIFYIYVTLVSSRYNQLNNNGYSLVLDKNGKIIYIMLDFTLYMVLFYCCFIVLIALSPYGRTIISINKTILFLFGVILYLSVIFSPYYSD
jgi:hypothetical protein